MRDDLVENRRQVRYESGLSKRLAWVGALWLLATSACGYDFQSKLKSVALEKPEFDEQSWLAPKGGTASARKFPNLRVNFARAADPGSYELVMLQPGDRLFVGAHVRGDIQAEPETGWAEAAVVSSLQDTFVEFKDVALPTGASDFSAGQQYVLAVRVVRGSGTEAQEVVRVPRVGAFVLDQGTVVASVPATSNAVDSSKPLGLIHRRSSFGFQGSCTFSRNGEAGADVLVGDVAYATLFGLRVSEVLDLSGYSKQGTGEYRFVLYVDTSALPETSVTASTGWGAIHLVCETASGTKNVSPTRLASGVDYTAPIIGQEVPSVSSQIALEGVSGSAPIRFSAPGATVGQVTFVSAGVVGPLLVLDKPGEPSSKSGPAAWAEVAYFQATASACSGGTADSRCLSVSVVERRAPVVGSYSIRVPFYDAAGNETIVVVLMQYRATALVAEDVVPELGSL